MKKQRYILFLFLALFIIACFAGSVYFFKNETPEMSYTDFLDYVEQDKVHKVVFSQDETMMTVEIENETVTYQVPNPKRDDFVEFLLLHDIIISYSGTQNTQTVVLVLLLGGCIAGIVWYTKRRQNNKVTANAEVSTDPATALTLNDIAGNVEAKSMVSDIIQFIRQPEKYTDVGAKMPRGILFYGPPGTGKTLMAKAIATEAGVPFYAMNGSDFIQMYVGVGASRIRELFKKAKKSEKAVIFIDEIDAIGKKRGHSPATSNDERDQTLNALLSEMSGFHDREGIIVIAATNRLDILDEALTRPGRFDRQIEIGLPDINARQKILELHCKSKALSSEVNLYELAKSTVYFSGAMLENLLNEAAILAANDNERAIKQTHIDKAFYTVIAGAEKTDRSYISKKDREITAYHEAGHALMTKLLLPEHFISKVTIIPSVKGAGGFSLSIPKDSLYLTKKQLEANIKVLFAGRVSEELIFGSDYITTGASNDISKASQLIVSYINTYGMDEELGLFHIQNAIEIPDPELIRRSRDKANELYRETKRELEEHLKLLKGIASELLEKETLQDRDIARICNQC